MTTALQVLNAARGQLGTTESPFGSNRQKYGEWYGMNGVAWCAEFVSWCANQAGGLLTVIPKFAYTPAGAGWFQARHQWSREPQVGDIVFFHWAGMSRISHTGIVESVSHILGTMVTLEGNTDVAGGGSGGRVMRQMRRITAIGQLGGFGHPRYDTTTTTAPQAPATPAAPAVDSGYEAYQSVTAGARTIRRGSAGDDVKQLQALLHIGVDGQFGDNTRAAVVTFQGDHGLEADGVVGPNTWAALLPKPGAAAPAFPLPAGYYYGPLSGPKKSVSGIAAGTNPAWVLGLRTAQDRLNAHLRGAGKATIGVDGKYGDATHDALVWYQTQRHNSFGLDIDGELGEETWNSLWK